MPQIRVLVVDDSFTIRAMLTRILEGDPSISIVGLAANAAEADQMILRLAIDVITLDVEMPGENGIDYLHRLAERESKIPVVMLSSLTGAGEKVRAEALRAGAVGCFNKADGVRGAPELIKLVKQAAAHASRSYKREETTIAEIKGSKFTSRG